MNVSFRFLNGAVVLILSIPQTGIKFDGSMYVQGISFVSLNIL